MVAIAASGCAIEAEPGDDTAATAAAPTTLRSQFPDPPAPDGRATALCGRPVPLPVGFTGSSTPGVCEGTCSVSRRASACVTHESPIYSIEVYGCTVKASENGFHCNEDNNGGELLGQFPAGLAIPVHAFYDDPRWCTIAIQVMESGAAGPTLKDFVIWERDTCAPPPPECHCTGLDYHGEPVESSTCGATMCGHDQRVNTCETDGWTATSEVCPQTTPACPTRHRIDTAEQLVTAVMAGDLSCAYVNIPIDVQDVDSEFAVALRTHWESQHHCGPPEEWRSAFEGIQAQGAVFGKRVEYVNFKGADLSGAIFEAESIDNWFPADAPARTQLSSAVFQGPVLRSVFIGANLQDATFTGPVELTSFEYADLTGASFQSPFMGGNDFTGATGTELVTWPTSPEDMLDLDATDVIAMCSEAYRENGFGATALAHAHDLVLPSIQLNDTFLVALLESGGDSLEELRDSGILFEELAGVLGQDAVQRYAGPIWRSYLYDRVDGEEHKRRIFDAVDGRYGEYSACDGDLDHERPLRGTTLWHLAQYPEIEPHIEDALLHLLRADAGSPVFLDDPYGGRTSTALEYLLDRSLADMPTAWDWLNFLQATETDANRFAWNAAEYNYRLEDIGLSQGTLDMLYQELGPVESDTLAMLAADTLVSLRDLTTDWNLYDAVVLALFDHFSDTETCWQGWEQGGIPLRNPGIEHQMAGPVPHDQICAWGPDGDTDPHADFPKPDNEWLGESFAHYLPGESEMVGQVTGGRFLADRSYRFSVHVEEGAGAEGVVPVQIGYLATDDDPDSFQPLASLPFLANPGWSQRRVSATVTEGDDAVGKQIMVRLGGAANGGEGDVWFDELNLEVCLPLW